MGFVKDVLGGKKPDAPDMSGQTRAANEANALQRQIYEESVERGQPFLETGQGAVSRLGELLGVSGDPAAAGYGTLLNAVDMNNWQQDPSYQFRLGEGQKALERSAAARGQLYSPSTSKALMDYGQNLASQEYGNIYNRRLGEQSNLYNRLAGVSGAGQTQAAQQTAAGQNMANTVGSTNMSLQQALTSQEMAQNQARASQFNNMVGNVARIGFALSDKRLKDNIEYVGEVNGHNVYEFAYVGQDKRYRGVMAQEVQETHPEAVMEIDGYLAVDYELINVPFTEVN